ncbi:type II secretion system protein [Variovorax sp. Sphag1AA]|uniref:type II secretion system protein n=1 Tax=Variovorax sp. Sphag1AA TaxID=2587027 RepID=UPI001619700C|nr:type II secretion system protein [Variovorax sp. Sphag1AA]MBB3176030.1 general secretion pathway protein G [Variovorax sp. Sphag1AA]
MGTIKPAPRGGRGFTLIELLVVLSVIAVLLTIAAPRYFGSIDKSKEQALRENLRVVRLTLDKFRADKGHWPKSLDDLVEDHYLHAVPLDPITESSSTWILIPPQDAEETGIADIKSGASGLTRGGLPYESY